MDDDIPLDLNKRAFIQTGTAFGATGLLSSTFPTRSEAIAGLILRFLFQRTLSRQAARMAGHTVSTVVKAGARSSAAPSLLKTAGYASVGVIGAVEAKRMWDEGQFQNLFSRQPDLVVDRNQQYLPMEFQSSGYQGDSAMEGYLSAIVIPQPDLNGSKDLHIETVGIGQGEFVPGEPIDLRSQITLSDMDRSKYVIIPEIEDLHTGKVAPFDYGVQNNAALIQTW